MQEEVRAASGEPTHDPCPCPQPRRLQAPLFGPQVPPERPYMTNYRTLLPLYRNLVSTEVCTNNCQKVSQGYTEAQL
jgi:hypothetical protein